jgi:hypothetical protein
VINVVYTVLQREVLWDDWQIVKICQSIDEATKLIKFCLKEDEKNIAIDKSNGMLLRTTKYLIEEDITR